MPALHSPGSLLVSEPDSQCVVSRTAEHHALSLQVRMLWVWGSKIRKSPHRSGMVGLVMSTVDSEVCIHIIKIVLWEVSYYILLCPGFCFVLRMLEDEWVGWELSSCSKSNVPDKTQNLVSKGFWKKCLMQFLGNMLPTWGSFQGTAEGRSTGAQRRVGGRSWKKLSPSTYWSQDQGAGPGQGLFRALPRSSFWNETLLILLLPAPYQ